MIRKMDRELSHGLMEESISVHGNKESNMELVFSSLRMVRWEKEFGLKEKGKSGSIKTIKFDK